MTLRGSERECDIHSGATPSADPDDRQAEEHGLRFSAVSEASAPSVRTPYVLVVDDEAFFRRVLSEAAERQGYTVLGARDASETLRFFERAAADDTPVIVLLDLMLPGMSGIELLYGLARRVGARVRFILCSAHSALDQVAPAHPLVSGRLAKPVEPAELESLLASASDALGATVH
jgi:CheY-like chemotaxis protein